MKVRLAPFVAAVVALLYGSAVAFGASHAPNTNSGAHGTKTSQATAASQGTTVVRAPAASSGSDTPAPACTSPPSQAGVVFTDPGVHCYTPYDIRNAYGVNALGDTSTGTGTLGQGQTIVLVDAYGTPTGANDLDFFQQTFYPNLPTPDFTAVYPQGNPPYNNPGYLKSNGLSGPSAAAGWAGEASLDIEWAYAIAPLAHIVLVAVPPAETEGVQGLPNLFKAIRSQIASEPGGTVFSMSFGTEERDFGGAALSQTSKFDAVFKQGIAKGDTFFSSAGDDGTTGTSKQHKEGTSYSTPSVGYPTSSPYVTSAGGTQLQYGWTWDPTSDVPFITDSNGNAVENPAYFQSTPGGDLNTVWNESWLPGAGGGGESMIYGAQPWQQSVAVGNPQVKQHRLLPDISWNAAVNGGVLVYQTSYPTPAFPAGWASVGGTSAASPQLAALTALADQKRAALGLSGGVGDINPAIYANTDWFNDVGPVTQGSAQSGQLVNNQLWSFNGTGEAVTPGPVPGWPTVAKSATDPTGYDMTTGLGTPNAAAYVNGLAATSDTTP